MYKKIIVLFMLMMYPLSIFAETCDTVINNDTDNNRTLTCDMSNKTVTTYTYSSSDLNIGNNSQETEEFKEKNFIYTGDVQTFIAPKAGNYTLEVWGAQGGKGRNANEYTYEGGYGAYSSGTIYLEKDETIYIYVGGQGKNSKNQTNGLAGGYNGGGKGSSDGTVKKGGTDNSKEPGSGGGGATHIARISGELSTFTKENIDDLLIVAGGGGGGAALDRGGHAGGIEGGRAPGYTYDEELKMSNACVGTQTSGYAIGKGGNGNENSKKYYHWGMSGGGAGFYGGCGGEDDYRGDEHGGSGGSGGSSYIGNAKLSNKVMFCYECTESSEYSTRTISTTNVSKTAISQHAKMGDGYAKISWLEDDMASLNRTEGIDFGYTGNVQTFTASKQGYYELEVWGAQGGRGMVNGKLQKYGGYGGYSKGIVYLNKDETIYIYVGGKGRDPENRASGAVGGYNGGGYGGSDYSGENCRSYEPGCEYEAGPGGGGATHISKKSGLLSDYSSNNLNDLLIVAGGGGGAASGTGNEISGGHAGGYKGSVGSKSTTECVGGQTNGFQIGVGGQGKGGSSGVGGGGAGFYGGCAGNTQVGSSGNGGSGYIGNKLLTNKAMYCYNCSESSEYSTKTISTTHASEAAISNYAKQGNGYARISYVQEDLGSNPLSNSVCDITCTEEVVFSFDPVKKVFAGTSFNYPLYVSGERKCTAKYHYEEYETRIKTLVDEYATLKGKNKETKGNEIENLYAEKKQCDQFVQVDGEYQNKYTHDGDVTLIIETSENDISIPYNYVDISEYSSNVLYDKASYYNACNFKESTKECELAGDTISGWTEIARIYGKYTMPDIYLENYTGKTHSVEKPGTCNAGDRYFVSYDEFTRPTKDDPTDNGYRLTLVAQNIGNNINTRDTEWDLTVNCWYQVKNVISPQKTDEMYERIGNTGFLYRIIDLDNPFPNREPGANWKGRESIITSTKDKISTLERFEINLDSTSIDKIREYNNKNSYEPFNIEIKTIGGVKKEYSTFINSSEFKNVIERK